MKKITSGVLTIGDLISRGAEAEIFRGYFLDQEVIIKRRVSKSYRNKYIDQKLRKERTTQEVRILQLAQENGLPVPRILDVEKENWTIVMSSIEGSILKNSIDEINIEKFQHLGKLVGKFHSLNIIHGDLTTSNIFYSSNNAQCFTIIDFGLGYISHDIEDKAVDLLVFKHTMESSHVKIASSALELFLEGYILGNIDAKEVLKRMDLVESRVRYKTH